MFYEKFEGLCEARNIKPETVMKSINLTPRAAEHWKNIPSRMPLPTTISKLETFFGVAPGYFTQDGVKIGKAPAEKPKESDPMNSVVSLLYRIAQLEKSDRVVVDAVVDALLCK